MRKICGGDKSTKVKKFNEQIRRERRMEEPKGELAESQQTINSLFTIDSKKNLVAVKSRTDFLKKRPKPSPFVIFLVVLLVVLVVGLVIISVLYYKKASVILCDTEDCMRIAASLKETMNTSVDPCDDFYQFVCGRWPQNHPPMCPSLMADHEYDWFSERNDFTLRVIKNQLEKDDDELEDSIPWAVNQSKILYKSCMHTNYWDDLGLEPIFNLLEQLDLPKTPSVFTNVSSDFVPQTAKVRRILGSNIFFSVYIDIHPKDSSKNIIVLDLPEDESPFPRNKILDKKIRYMRKLARRAKEEGTNYEAYDNETLALNANYYEATTVFMSEVIKYILSNGTVDDPVCKIRDNFTEVPEALLEEVIAKLIELQDSLEALAGFHENQTFTDDLEDYLPDSSYMTLDNLQNITDEYVRSANDTLVPILLWKPFVTQLFREFREFDENTTIILVAALDYMKDVAVLLASTDERLLESFVWWKVVEYTVPYLTKELRKIHFTYVNSMMSGEWSCQRSIRCGYVTSELMGMAVGWLYVNPTFKKADQVEKVAEMFSNIRSSFTQFLSEIKWMDVSTKLATLEKNKRMTSLIGYPEWLFNETKLNEFYAGINMSVYTHLANMIQIIHLSVTNEFKELFKRNDLEKNEWPISPSEVNAVHIYQVNQIAVPAAILQFPFYGLGLEALNYGAIGSILGHELTHGFDNTGRLFDKDGNMKQWWTNDTINSYRFIASCFIDQYNEYYVEEVDDYIDGQKTLGENIADHGGFRQAYNAYQIWKSKHGKEPLLPGFTDYTHEQLLFLGYAHIWCESYTTTGLKFMLDDTHCPGHIRLLTVLQNSKEFSKAWKCPVESKMNPSKKCQLW